MPEVRHSVGRWLTEEARVPDLQDVGEGYVAVMRALAVLCVCLWMASATADARPSHATDMLGKAEALARAYWHDAPCQPTEWRDAPPEYGGWSLAYNDVCWWGLNPIWRTWSWSVLCPIVVHEYGHLAGHEHVDDPASVMYGGQLQAQPQICGLTSRRTPVVVASR